APVTACAAFCRSLPVPYCRIALSYARCITAASFVGLPLFSSCSLACASAAGSFCAFSPAISPCVRE
ncbi:hypothetical protein, partial [Serratia marcescens]|uniref:hypothetical protein n=1 Tax=Serratia marcescens TaxID=615 RepID=UPI001F45CA12